MCHVAMFWTSYFPVGLQLPQKATQMKECQARTRGRRGFLSACLSFFGSGKPTGKITMFEPWITLRNWPSVMQLRCGISWRCAACGWPSTSQSGFMLVKVLALTSWKRCSMMGLLLWTKPCTISRPKKQNHVKFPAPKNKTMYNLGSSAKSKLHMEF